MWELRWLLWTYISLFDATVLQDIKKRYPVIVDFGSGAGHIVKHLDRDITQKVIMCDSARKLFLNITLGKIDRHLHYTNAFLISARRYSCCVEDLLYRDSEEEYDGKL